MIQCTVTLDREDIIKILAKQFGVDPDRIQMHYVETSIEDDIRAVIDMPNPLTGLYHDEYTHDDMLKREFQKKEGSGNDWDPMRDLRITCREVPKEMG